MGNEASWPHQPQEFLGTGDDQQPPQQPLEATPE